MPFLDVTDLLHDPEIAGETFQVVRRPESVNPFGETVIINQIYAGIGQISTTPPTNLMRMEAYTSTEKTIYIITDFKLTLPAAGYQADLVKWKNDYYMVNRLEDYSQYGAGFVAAACGAYDWSMEPTTSSTESLPSLDLSKAKDSQFVPIF
jgi:galactose-6-phosphate isomerase